MLIQCDFDGTITEEDIGFMLLDTFAEGDWRKWLQQYMERKISVGYFNTKAFAMVKASREDLLGVTRNKAKLRDGFHELISYCQSKGFRFVIVSNGLDFYIKSILEDAGLGDIEVHAAQTQFHPDGLKVQYIGPDGAQLDSDFKKAYIGAFQDQGYQVIYVGNGASDISPAVHAHHIFARGELLNYCRKMDLQCTPFDDLNDITRGLESLQLA
ncbi:2-hydroxy-3-keto-5-methylthiopentenyl-1-phosphate phosphatase [subsurface metagenome]